LIYLNQGAMILGGGGGVTLTGSDASGTYKGLLIFGSRTLVRHSSGNGVNQPHSLGGSSTISLVGSIYLVNSDADMRAGTYQLLSFGGGGTSTTGIRGEIIVGAIAISGTGAINMTLDRSLLLSQDQIALVN
jgi:hypothetical protein